MTYKPTAVNSRRIDLAILSLLIVALLLLMIGSQSGKSPVMDELVGPAVGLAQWRGDSGFLDVHPPLARLLHGMALLGTDAPIPYSSNRCDSRRALQICVNEMAIAYFYQPAVSDPDALLDRARRINQLLAAVGLLLSCLVALIVGGRPALIICGLLFLTSPMWIAHGRIATNDMPYTIFSLAALITWWRFRATDNLRWLILLGPLCGAAFSAKFSAIPLLIGLGLVIAIDAFTNPEKLAAAVKLKEKKWLGALIALMLPAGGFILTVLIVYGGSLISLLRDLILLFTRMEMGHAAYFFGKTSMHGWTWYFPVAFLIKTPVGTLLLISITLVLALKHGIKAGLKSIWNTWSIPFLVPGFIFALMSLSSSVNIGLRYWLPLYPILFILVGYAVSTIRVRRGWGLLLSVILLINIASTWRAYPHYLSYFNELVGGSAKGYRYLSDSNLDWGQDLAGLKKTLDDRGIDRVILASFSPVPPAHYGLSYQWLYSIFNRENPDAGPVEQAPNHLAVSVSLLTGQYAPDLAWLKDIEPIDRVGWSIHLFDITNDAQAHLKLAEFYAKLNLPRTSAAHLKRAREIKDQSL